MVLGMIIRVEKRHVVYVVSVCGILNEGGEKKLMLYFPQTPKYTITP